MYAHLVRLPTFLTAATVAGCVGYVLLRFLASQSCVLVRLASVPQPFEATPMTPSNINPVQWTQSQGLARQTCARVFRDGGSPADALAAFGVKVSPSEVMDWGRTVDAIAQSLCATDRLRRAA